MVIPTTFADAISQAFYDKTFTTYSSEEKIELDGWAGRSSVITSTGTFLGNITFKRMDLVQREFGLDQQIDAMITTAEDVEENTIIGYRGEYYTVYRALPFDSHNKLMLKEWRQKLSV